MSRDEWRTLVRGILDDIARVDAFIRGMEREDFVRDDRTVFAVSYAFVRIGEAVARLPEDVLLAHPTVEWREARRFRNFVIHVYDAVDPARLYDTARTDLPVLAMKLDAILRGP